MYTLILSQLTAVNAYWADQIALVTHAVSESWSCSAKNDTMSTERNNLQEWVAIILQDIPLSALEASARIMLLFPLV